ncbi:tetratricopeptide repeat protein [Clostridium homopropionicum DSM 5847]|uniref:Tetratricopeptide repeat protein n=1 Tax=Clostridium homopropionicum DSM 5847 TaxID=1121318 RepID=A0A0L6Z8C1_9CLOT|nr:tetratricopeptide repeat protein [Clostridium homopropionicum]KOA19216.1 tetratricopeptide repeat protein [Clostridium homopropionicum DSM 5847]SFG17686.1 Tetratricopeptide repeat-containing protein [Clostridium homopropionicum]
MKQKIQKYNINKADNLKTSENSGVIIEAEKPLSQSMLWKLQTDFFANQGPEAWIKGIVPQYITTNPYIANLYAKTVFGYFRDYASREGFDKNTTIYIMELASGVGRFTYTFLNRFLHMIENSSLKGLKFKYIVTDLADRNIEYWQNHSFLKPYFESGVLDCATFDMTHDEEIRLRNSGEMLKEGKLKNPLILFANYTFDSLPQDTFYVDKGKLFEGLITITSLGEEVDPSDKSILAGLDYYYTDKQIQGNDYYEDSNFNDILLHYKKHLEDTAFSLPIIALRCIARLKKLFKDDIIMLSADKGYKNQEAMYKNYHPYLSKHGCISMTVNFHALELYFKGLGGKAIHSIYEHENVNMSLFLLSQSSHDFIETEMAYNEIIESIGPDDFYIIKKGIVPLNKSLTTKELLTFLRFTVWDGRTFLEFYNTLLERIANEEDFPKYELISVIYNIWDHYFPIGEDGDLAYYLGTILAYFGYDSDALKLFESSIEFYGEDAAIYYEIALCNYNLQKIEKALECIEKSLSLDPDFEESKNLKNLIEEILI